jgi:multiple sugar transport system substrate-binding protein
MKKRWKSKLAALLVLTMLTAVLATGCSSEKKTALDPENPVTITVWNYYTGAQQESFNKLVSEFNETEGKELGITVQASSEGGVSDLEEHILEAAEKKVGAKEMPNVFMAYSDTVYTLDEMGVIEDLSEYLTDEELEEYEDSYLAEGEFGTTEGGLKIFPIAKATEIFFLNQTDWEKFAEATGAELADLETIEGVVETAEKYYEWTDSLTEEEEDGKAFFGRDSMANYMLVGAEQLGHPIFTKDDNGEEELTLDEDTIRKLWDCYYVPYINGYFGSAGRFRSDDVKTGTILSFVGSSAGATFFPSEVFVDDDESYEITSGIMAAPQFADGENYVVQQGAGMAVSKASEAEVEASIEFLKWFTDTERNVQFSIDSGYLPVKKEANDVDLIKSTTTSDSATTDGTSTVEDGDSITTEIIEVAINSLNDGAKSYFPAMSGGADVRNILEYSMSDQAGEDREKVVEAIEAGTSREEAVAAYDTDEHFDEWYQTFKEKLETAIQ